MGVCIKCGRPLGGDYGGWCGMCDYCPRCHRVVDRIHIYWDDDNGYCTWCENDYLAEKQAQLEAIYDIFQNDEDDINDVHEEDEDSLFSEPKIFEPSGETKIKVIRPKKRTFKDFVLALLPIRRHKG